MHTNGYSYLCVIRAREKEKRSTTLSGVVENNRSKSHSTKHSQCSCRCRNRTRFAGDFFGGQNCTGFALPPAFAAPNEKDFFFRVIVFRFLSFLRFNLTL